VKVLTDTHSLVWALSDPGSLSAKARNILTEEEVVTSAANLWELLLKMSKSDALLANPAPWWEKYVVETGIPILPIRSSHVLALGRLPGVHKDPFDRILVAQAVVENLPIISKDTVLAQYGIAVIW
jgi:PIN domain nuclease of toxin-antitoxin system